jgi:hypothetical protein
VQVIDTTDRAAVGHLITMREYVDVIVPRGGKGLISRLPPSAGADDPAPRRQLPRLSRRRPTLDKASPSSRTPRRSATAPATPWNRCWWPVRVAAAICCRRSPPCYTAKGVEMRGCRNAEL